MTDLQLFFRPNSVAVVGASADPKSISGRPLRLLVEMNYPGRVYPVNPKYDSLAGLRCYPSLSSLPEVPDMVLIAVNAKVALKILEECQALGVKFAIVFSSGFAEAGNSELQAELDRVVRAGDTRICGPNCQGMVNLFDSFPASFSAALDEPGLRAGPVAFLSQSGALGFSTFNMAQEKGLGFGYVVTTGNQCDIEVTELAEHLLHDDKVNVVICYLEGIKSVDSLRSAARTARDVRKPLCVLKVGRSAAGQKAAQSHTAALAGTASVFDAFARQNNIVLLNDTDDVLNAAAIFGPGKLPRGNRVGILTSSGGAGILMADRCEELGLVVPELPGKAQEVIRKYIPAFGSPRNPVDLTAQVMNEASGFRTCLDAVLQCESIDVVVVMMTMIVGESGLQVASDVIEASKLTDKPLVVCWTIGARTGPMTGMLASAGVPVYSSPAACARSIAMLVNYAERLRQDEGGRPEPVPSRLVAPAGPALASIRMMTREGRPLTEYDAKRLLSEYGIPVTREAVALDPGQAARMAREIGFPVALKVSSPDIPHKTEAGGVRLGLKTEAEVREAFEQIMRSSQRYKPSARIEGVLVQEMVSGGTEVIIGVNKDPQFGPTVMFGLGGIFVEVLKDVAFRVAPLDFDEAFRMIKDTKAYSVLLGARGKPRADIDALADLLVKISRLAWDAREVISELDLNPVIVLPEGKGAKVVDALLVPACS